MVDGARLGSPLDLSGSTKGTGTCSVDKTNEDLSMIPETQQRVLGYEQQEHPCLLRLLPGVSLPESCLFSRPLI